MGYSKREVVVVVMVVTAVMMVGAEAAISCGTVSSALSPCLGYLQGTGAAPSGGCCSGVKSLYAATKSSKPDRVTSCGCIKSLAAALGSKLKSGNVGNLPGKCGVNLGYSISTSTNCNSIP